MFLLRVLAMSALFMFLVMPSAAQAGPFEQFFGRWSGTGQFKLSNNSEGGKCVSTFLRRSTQAAEVNVRCAIASGFKVEIQCNFGVSGNAFSGPCQVRSHSNEQYHVTGRLAGNTLSGVAQSAAGRVSITATKLGGGLRIVAAGQSWSIQTAMVR